MENNKTVLTKRDIYLGLLAGLIIGLIALPVLKAAQQSLFDQVAVFLVPFFLLAVPIGLVIASWISKKIAIVWQLSKFIVIGGMNTLLDLGVLSLVTFAFRSFFNIESKATIIFAITFYSLFKATSFIVANISSYYWNKYWTFQKDSSEEDGAKFIQFFLVSIVGFLINVVVASYVFKAIQPFAGMNSDQWGLIGAAAGAIVGLAWNFLGYKFIVFKK
jgi:putative flippase GtrA